MSSVAIDYRSYLRAELARRSTINPSYSLRAFARALSLAPGALSEILNGKRTLGPKKAMEITQKLALGPDERNWFLKSLERKVPAVDLASGANASVINPASDFEIKGFIDADTWALVSDWLPWAIVSKLRHQPTVYSIENAALCFGVQVDKVQQAINSLAKKGFVKIHPDGLLERVDNNTIAHAPELADAIRRHNRDVLIKAIESIENFGPKDRVIGNRIFATNSKKIKAAEEKVAAFRKELMEFLQEGSIEDQDTVYCFTTTLFPLENKKGGSNEN